MSERHEWVLLVECYNMAELHTLRSMLQAHGIPFRVDGEHTHGILGPLQGAMARSRVMVPRPALAEARELSEDIVGPFDDSADEDDQGPRDSPFRVPALIEEAAPATTTLRPKSYAALTLIGFTGLAFLGVGHVYVGRSNRAGALAFTTLVSIALHFNGATWATILPPLVWFADLVGGAIGISQHNARVRAMNEHEDAADEPEAAEADDDAVEDNGEDDDEDRDSTPDDS